MSFRFLTTFHKSILRKSSLFSTMNKPHPLKHVDFRWNRQQHSLSATGQFDIVSFNMLAPCYKRLAKISKITGNRLREESNLELWTHRAQNTLQFVREEFFQKNISVLALQEFWQDPRYRAIFNGEFTRNGYDVRLLQRTGSKTDAVAIAVKSDQFDTLGSENIYLCAENDRVALMLWLRHRDTRKNVLVVSAHLSFPHSACDRLKQLKEMEIITVFLDQYAARQGIGAATRIVLGDFNVEGRSSVCDHLRAEGYYSCFEVCPPVNAPPPPPVQTTASAAGNDKGDGSENGSVTDGSEDNRDSFLEPPQSPIVTYRDDGLSSLHDGEDDYDRGCNADCDVFDAEQLKLIARARFINSLSGGSGGGGRGGSDGISDELGNEEYGEYGAFEFVSHHTHKEEDLGVDHIFVRPEITIVSADDGAAMTSNSVGDDFQGERPAAAAVTMTGEQMQDSVEAATSSAATGSATSSEGASSSGSGSGSGSSLLSGVFVRQTTIVPESLSSCRWHDGFDISDHRPVQARIVFGERRRDSSSSDEQQQ